MEVPNSMPALAVLEAIMPIILAFKCLCATGLLACMLLLARVYFFVAALIGSSPRHTASCLFFTHPQGQVALYGGRFVHTPDRRMEVPNSMPALAVLEAIMPIILAFKCLCTTGVLAYALTCTCISIR